MLGETNFGILSTTSILKKLVGGDVIGFEKKGKDPFDDYNYAKIIIATNSLPTSDDSSDGFMRRWHIIDFPNEFPEGKDIISTIPTIEYNNLSRKIFNILRRLLDNGCFTNQGDINTRKHKYMMASNPLPLFINKYCEKGTGLFESYSKMYTEYVKYLQTHKKRKVKTREFKGSLENEGYYVDKTSIKINNEFKSGYWIMGLKLCDNCDNYDTFPTPKYIGDSNSKNTHNCHNCHKQDVLTEKCYLPCTICGLYKEDVKYNLQSKPVCSDCNICTQMNTTEEKVS
jgi:phage/plasmid-associated DNA primase